MIQDRNPWGLRGRHRLTQALASAGAVLAIAVGPNAHSQSARVGLSEGDFLRDIPPVVTASRLPQLPQDAPGLVTVIDRDFIESVGARDIAELMRFVPGFMMGVARGGQPVVAYHGLSSQIAQRVQVIVDGRSLYAPYLFGGVDWAALNIDVLDIERIEVVQGSNSATFGANAFLGVVSITTRSPAQSVGFGAHLRTGTNGVRGAGLQTGAQGDFWGYRITAGRRGDDGLAGLRDAHAQTFVDGRAEFQLSPRDELTVQAGSSSQRQALGFPNLALDPERVGGAQSRFALLRWQHLTQNNQAAIVTLSHTVDTGKDAYDLFLSPGEFLRVDYGRRAHRTALNYWQTAGLSKGLRAVWGVEGRWDAVRAPQLFNTLQTQTSFSSRGYANLEWQAHEKWTLNLGASIEHESISGRQLAPRGFVNFKPTVDHTFKLGYSRAFRTPSLFEQRSDWRFVYQGETLSVRFLSSGNLLPEQVESTEAIYQGRWPAAGLSADVRLFRERVSEVITSVFSTLPPGPGIAPGAVAFDLRNLGTSRLEGVEYKLQWNPTWRFQLTGTQFQRLNIESDLTRLRQSVPERAGSVVASYVISPDWSASLHRTWLSRLTWIGEDTSADAQHLLGWRLAWKGRWASSQVEWSLAGRRVRTGVQEFRELQALRNETWTTLTLSY